MPRPCFFAPVMDLGHASLSGPTFGTWPTVSLAGWTAASGMPGAVIYPHSS